MRYKSSFDWREHINEHNLETRYEDAYFVRWPFMYRFDVFRFRGNWQQGYMCRLRNYKWMKLTMDHYRKRALWQNMKRP